VLLEDQDRTSQGAGGKEILAAQVEHGYGQLPISLVVNLVNGFILAAVLWDVTILPKLIVWSMALITVTGARYYTLRAFRATSRGAQFPYATWRRYFALGACAAGMVWGLAAVLLFHPESFAHQVFLAFLLGGMVAGALPLLSSLDHAYSCFAIPIIVPIALQMLLAGDRIHLIMALMIVIFAAAMFASSIHVGRLFNASEQLRQKLASSLEVSRELEQMLRLDALTEIANRRLFEEELELEWRRAKREGGVLSVITADVDYFKEYNDQYGHPAGDECLVKLAKAMHGALSRPGDLVARIGGEEFAFLLPRTSLSGSRAVAELVQERILELNLPHEASAVVGQVTLSMGIASSDHASVASPAELLRASDMALYDAKRRGRNRIAAFGAETRFGLGAAADA
jgi:diguanylate cyclase (GGDEF)-like protein